MIPSEILLYNQKLNKTEQLTKADLKKYRKLEVYASEVDALNMAETILAPGECYLSLDKSWYDAKKDESGETGTVAALEAGRKSFAQGAKALYTLASRLAARKTPEYRLAFKVNKRTNEVLQLSAEIVLEDYPPVVIGEFTIVRKLGVIQEACSSDEKIKASPMPPNMEDENLQKLMKSSQEKGFKALVVVAYYGSKRCANKLERNILDLAKALALVLLVSRQELWSREEVPKAEEKSCAKAAVVKDKQSSEEGEAKNSIESESDKSLVFSSMDTGNKKTSELTKDLETNGSLGVFAKSLRSRLGNSKVVLVGGNDNWRKKMAAVFENPMVIEGKNFEPAKLQDAALVIINTNEVGHAVTKKASGLAADDRIKYIYTSKYNIEAIAQDILNQLEV